MARLLALLRGINVGGHRKVPMAELRDLAADAGFTDVQTYIQSGNLLLTASGRTASVAAKLEAAIGNHFGFPVDVVVRTAGQWSGYAAANPFREAAEATPNLVMLGVSRDSPRADAADDLAARASNGEQVTVVGDAVWFHFPNGSGRSKLTPAAIDKAVGSPTTLRNWKTVVNLQELLAEP